MGSVHSLRQYWSVEAKDFSIKLAYAWSPLLVPFLASFHIYKFGRKALKPIFEDDGICEGSGGMCEGCEHIVSPQTFIPLSVSLHDSQYVGSVGVGRVSTYDSGAKQTKWGAHIKQMPMSLKVSPKSSEQGESPQQR